MADIKGNIRGILEHIPDSVKLLAVSKTRSILEMEEVYELGIRDFGENKVQEIIYKYDNFHKDVKWHLIGHLQRNKVKYIVGKVALIHSLDSIELLSEIEKRYASVNLIAECLVQINIGNEASKTGISIDEFEKLIQAVEECQNVRVKGLMAIIPSGSTDECKNYFRKMKNIWDKMKVIKFKNISMDYLSMGMSGDYKLAIEEGSNIIRIGEGIFGKREYTKL